MTDSNNFKNTPLNSDDRDKNSWGTFTFDGYYPTDPVKYFNNKFSDLAKMLRDKNFELFNHYSYEFLNGPEQYQQYL